MKTKLAGMGGATQTYVDDVFSTWLYTGNDVDGRLIQNNIDLLTNGGMVWIKARSSAQYHTVADTNRGMTNTPQLATNTTDPASGYYISSYANNGFSVYGSAYGPGANAPGITYASWTFRKAAKFFDVVTYTGNGASSKLVNHSLGVVPGLILIKRTDSASQWFVVASLDGVANVYGYGGPSTDSGALNTTEDFYSSTSKSTTATSSTIDVSKILYNVGGSTFNSTAANVSGGTYVMYLFANDTSSNGIIQCGAYTGNGNATGPSVNLGWEPQYVMIKNYNVVGYNWNIMDSMRGMAVGSTDSVLMANSANAETSVDYIAPTATGFNIVSSSAEVNQNGKTYIYMAIRRPNKPPTTGTQVYKGITRTGTGAAATVTGVGFAPDLVMSANRSSAGYGNLIQSRLNGTSIVKHPFDNSDTTSTVAVTSFNMDGYSLGIDSGASGTGEINRSGDTFINWLLKRYVGVFDQICWVGTNSTTKRLAHNLGVIPELALMKASNPQWWFVYHKDLGISKYLYLNQPNAVATFNVFGTLAPTATDIGFNEQAQDTNTTTLGTNTGTMYLFATLAGISKVGSYTGNGGTQNIDCGFAAGARFVLIKCTSTTGDWFVWDTARGIVAANDPHLSLNTTAAEVTTDDSIDPLNAGFTVNQVTATNINVSSATYIYLAIA